MDINNPGILDGSVNPSKIAAGYGLVPSGVMLPFGGTAAPSGWLLCDGSSVLRATYPDLFTAIGVTWGSVDGTHFTLPDMSRRTPVGSGGIGTATLGNAVGNTGGEEGHVLTVAELATHDHAITDPGHHHTFNTTSGSAGVSATAQATLNTATPATIDLDASTGITINSNGSDTAHNTIQPSAVVLMIIKT